ncbi:MAG: xanthine dehydrogenase family protein subunit M [Candidatus Riflebacteria bacterium]|nr:xanthine dehydrogenase family protein subunit M [Candidatus Riflebacteria bacterium]
MPGEFTYCAPIDSTELMKMLEKYGSEGRILAGGTDLLVDARAGRIKPKVLIDIKKVSSLATVSFTEKDGLSIGAAVTCSDIIQDQNVRQKYSLLSECASQIGSPQLRNRATIAGNICTASPCADMAPALLCLGASVDIVSSAGTRTVKLSDFFTGVKQTALKAGEYLGRIIVPAASANLSGAFEKLKRIKGHDISLASVAAVKTDNAIRIAVGSCAVTPLLIPEFPLNSQSSEIWKTVQQTIKPISDIRASAEYRMVMVKAFVDRVIARLNREAK